MKSFLEILRLVLGVLFAATGPLSRNPHLHPGVFVILNVLEIKDRPGTAGKHEPPGRHARSRGVAPADATGACHRNGLGRGARRSLLGGGTGRGLLSGGTGRGQATAAARA